MSEKQFERCTLEEATHVDVGGKVHKLGYDYSAQLLRRNSHNIEVTTENRWQLIHVDAFPLLGIQPLKEKKQEPIEFEATFVKHDGQWHPLYSLYGVSYLHNKKAKFKCVEILEEEEKK